MIKITAAAATMAIMAASAEALLNLGVNLPLGISVDLDLFGPSEDPCSECTDTWHPPHDVIIDDCDDTGNGHWHWVHPCPEPPQWEEEYIWTTSTFTATHVSTIVDCGPDVDYCPGHSTVYTTVTVPGETTICPVPVTSTHGPPVVHPVPTTTAAHMPPPSTHPAVHPPPVQTHIPQPPPVVVVPHPSSNVWTGPVPTMTTSVHVPSQYVPVPTAPVHHQPPVVVQPPHVNPPAPVVPAPQPTHGNNGTIPVIPPPTATRPPVPTAAAGRNARNLGLVVLAGAIALYAL